jgi:nicotinamide riboside transporter PnuC
MIELIGTIATVLAICGVWLNNRKLIACFYLWFISNGLSAIIHWRTGTWSLMARDVIFIVLAVEGIRLWAKDRKAMRKNIDDLDDLIKIAGDK